MYLSRRAFLKSLGAVSALPFVRMLERSAFAQAQPPTRFLSVFNPHGWVRDLWLPQGTETNFNITYPNAILAPLDPYKAKCIFLGGVDYRVLYEKGSETGHRGAPCTFLTGTGVVENGDDVYPQGPSLDQFLASKFGSATKLRSLELSASGRGGTASVNTINYSATGARVPSQYDPAQVYARLFADYAGGTQSDAEMKRRLARKQSVLDAVSGDLQRLSGRLAGPERQKLDQHLSTIRDIEHRLTLGGGVTCTKPNAPATIDPLGATTVPQVTQLMIDLMVQAFACDLTRFGSLQMWFGATASTMPFLGLDMNIHDDIAHKVDSPGDEGATARQRLGKVQNFFASQFAYLLKQLDAVSEAGGTALDHTIILWGNELSDTDGHSCINIPMILAGGGGKFRMGRYVQTSMIEDTLCTGAHGSGTCTEANQYSEQTAHNGVLVAIAQAFGVQTDTFGDPSYKGPLPNLLV